MSPSLSEQLTFQFYDWEKRGRGWYVFDSPIELEPPFQPFYRTLPQVTHPIDDGKRPSLFAAPFHFLQKLLTPPSAQPVALQESAIQAPVFRGRNHALEVIQISLPQGAVIDYLPMEQLLVVLSTSTFPISFEIVAKASEITMQLVCRHTDALFVKSQVKAYFPECSLEDASHTLSKLIQEDNYLSAIDFGLNEEFMRPIAACERLSLDPLTGLFGMLEHLSGSDTAVIQILFQGTSYPWTQSILASVTDTYGDCFFSDAPEMLTLAQEKVESPLFAVVIRAIGQSPIPSRADDIAEGVAQMLIQTSRSYGNTFCALVPYDEYTFKQDILLRESHRQGMLLNSKELLTFVHFPTPSVVSDKLVREVHKTKAFTSTNSSAGFILGTNYHQGKATPVTVSAEQRLKHTHIIGATGTGKSTLLVSLIQQDIQLGSGFAVLDPHGDLIDTVISRIPPDRYEDVVLIDPSDMTCPVGFNFLTAHSDIEKDVLSSDLISVFRRLSSSWGDQMNSVLANAILAFLESSEGGTLMDLRRFLIEKSFREKHLRTVTDPHIVYYWQNEFPLLRSASIGPILTRLDTFLRPKPIRYMVAQRKGIDFEHILDSNKILLIKLSQGLIGDENSYILGTTFVSKLYQAAMARQSKAKSERRDFFLYIDEFQNFITPSMAAILSGARKYHLGLVLAHQDMQQLVKMDNELASAVLSNAATRVCFRLGDADAKRFESGFAHFDEYDLQNLSVGEAIVRIERAEKDCNLKVSAVRDIDTTVSQERRQTIIAKSQQRYGTPKEQVDALFHFPKEAEQVIETQQVVVVPALKEPQQQQPTQEIVSTQEQPQVKSLTEEQIQATKERLVQQKQLSQHRYLQTLIKKMAEARGYKATIEAPTPDGQGKVDVSLERNGKRIACEIGVTTSKLWEVHNVEKCLAAGYDIVVAVPVDTHARDMMQKAITQNLNQKLVSKVLVMEADTLFHHMDAEAAKEVVTEKRIKGYRVKVEYDAVSQDEMKAKRELITKFIISSTKK